VPYVLVQTRDPKAKVCDMAEDPKYAAAHRLPLERLHYVEHQIVNPVTSLLEFVDEVEDPHALFAPYVRELRRKRDGNQNITKFLTAALTTAPAPSGAAEEAVGEPAVEPAGEAARTVGAAAPRAVARPGATPARKRGAGVAAGSITKFLRPGGGRP